MRPLRQSRNFKRLLRRAGRSRISADRAGLRLCNPAGEVDQAAHPVETQGQIMRQLGGPSVWLDLESPLNLYAGAGLIGIGGCSSLVRGRFVEP